MKYQMQQLAEMLGAIFCRFPLKNNLAFRLFLALVVFTDLISV